MAVRWVTSASGQWSRPHSIECASVSHEKWDDNGFAPPHSLDLAPCYFFLFQRMKRDLKGKCFENVEEVREKTTEALKAITLQEFQNCSEHWKSGGISVLILKESILRVIKFWKCSEKYTILKRKLLVIFGSPLIYGNVTVLLFVIQFYMAMLQCSCTLFNSIWQCYSALVCY